MNEINITEHKGVVVLTTQQLATSYGTETQIITNNFNRNKDRYLPGKHFICLEGDEKKQFLNQTQIDLGSLKNAKSIYLWTEKGAFLHAKSLNTDKAWEVYDRLVDNYFSKKHEINISELSPELRMFQQIFNSVAQQQLEQKRQAKEIEEVKNTVRNMKREMIEPIADWRTEINSKIREISSKSNIPYQDLYNKMYSDLEQKAHCSLNRLCAEKKKRMDNAGNTKTCIKNETSKIAIIEGKPQLKAIFEDIVRKYAFTYCI